MPRLKAVTDRAQVLYSALALSTFTVRDLAQFSKVNIKYRAHGARALKQRIL